MCSSLQCGSEVADGQQQQQTAQVDDEIGHWTMFILVWSLLKARKNDAINSNNTYIQRKQNSQEQLSSLAPGLGPSQVCLLLLLSTLFTLCNLYTCTFLLNPQVQPGQRLYVLPAKPTHIKRFASLRLTHVNNKVNGNSLCTNLAEVVAESKPAAARCECQWAKSSGPSSAEGKLLQGEKRAGQPLAVHWLSV